MKDTVRVGWASEALEEIRGSGPAPVWPAKPAPKYLRRYDEHSYPHHLPSCVLKPISPGERVNRGHQTPSASPQVRSHPALPATPVGG